MSKCPGQRRWSGCASSTANQFPTAIHHTFPRQRMATSGKPFAVGYLVSLLHSCERHTNSTQMELGMNAAAEWINWNICSFNESYNADAACDQGLLLSSSIANRQITLNASRNTRACVRLYSVRPILGHLRLTSFMQIIANQLISI